MKNDEIDDDKAIYDDIITISQNKNTHVLFICIK